MQAIPTESGSGALYLAMMDMQSSWVGHLNWRLSRRQRHNWRHDLQGCCRSPTRWTLHTDLAFLEEDWLRSGACVPRRACLKLLFSRTELKHLPATYSLLNLGPHEKAERVFPGAGVSGVSRLGGHVVKPGSQDAIWRLKLNSRQKRDHVKKGIWSRGYESRASRD